MNFGGKPTPRVLSVLGLGHVGLPTALGFAELGFEVIGADDDAGRVALVKSGKLPFFEPGLQSLLDNQLKTGRFRLSESVGEAIRDSEVVFVCVSTPQREDGSADLSMVEAVARTIAQNLNEYKLIVSKSTVPAITGQWIKRTIIRYAENARRAAGDVSDRNGSDFDVASNPEFLQEGKAVENIFHPDRVVIGVESDRAREILESIYRPFNCPLVVVKISTAELVKHAANAFLSTKISFINMVADLCEAVGADVDEVAKGLGLDPRIGGQFLQAGIGFGGSCFPKDLRALIHMAEEHGVDCGILKEVVRVNLNRPKLFVKKIQKALWVLKGKTLGVWGLAFKPETDDIREAPSLKIAKELLAEGACLRLYDPKAMTSMQRVLPEAPAQVTYCTSALEAARGVDALLLVTEWSEFRDVDLVSVREVMNVPVLFDGRNFLDPGTAVAAGFEYHCVGSDIADEWKK